MSRRLLQAKPQPRNWAALNIMAALAVLLTQANAADPSPVGLWRIIDDNTGLPRAEVRLFERDGALSARIERSLAADPSKEERYCTRCTDDRKGQALVGMEIIRGAKRSSEPDWWDGGTILDPENGKTYALRMRVEPQGKTLLLRGYLGPFFRTQRWVRTDD